ncbi:enoyl-CoA hydratase family protein [Streptomyces sp. OF3]|uniref:Enoyl-CoA hydratase family protein n=1 Tax=Streptomyces alkaliterrae TaxID=2213162 RepID=A0A7W3ZLZ6_9ACTN|nr:enoyl-CoA hydratase family protein [Streptomyces alkaliterrae]MBB1253228.1 enoyl-CoA hydratase family protein [Streptomyces alkaliterrae]
MTAPVRRADERGVRTLTLDSPGNRNALSSTLMRVLTEELAAAGEAPEVRAVVLTHTGNTFCAGADLTDPAATPAALVELLRGIVELPKPVAARVDGHARGGGLGLVGACDVAVAGAASRFAFSEVRIGVAPAVISLPLLPRLDPRAASRYYLTGEVFDAEQATRAGLLTDWHTDVDTALEPITDAWRRCAPGALAEAKHLVTAEVRRAFARDADSLVALSARLFGTAEAREGMTAFLERRDPPWAR